MSNEMKRYASEDYVDSKINSIFEKHNTFTIEYAEPIKISLADIPIFNKVISNGTATYGTVEIVDGQTFIYTPTTYLLGAETVVLTFDDNTTYDVYINPADNIYYDASFFNIADAAHWSYVEDDTGSYVVTTTNDTNAYLTPHFVGTGFTLLAKHSLDDGATCTLLVQCANKGNLLATSTTNSMNGYNLPVYARDISEHDTWDVRIARNNSNPEGAKLELSGIRIYNTIYDESSPSYISIANRVKKSNNDTSGTATSVIYLTYNTETKAFERTLLNDSVSNSQIYHAFEINETGDNPKVYVSANAQSSKSTLSSVDSYNDNVAVSHSKSAQVNDGVMKFYPLEIVNYNDKNYVLVSSFTGTTNYDMIKCVDCEIVTQADQAAVDAFVEDVIRIANGTLIATMETAKQLEEAIGDIPITKGDLPIYTVDWLIENYPDLVKVSSNTTLGLQIGIAFRNDDLSLNPPEGIYLFAFEDSRRLRNILYGIFDSATNETSYLRSFTSCNWLCVRRYFTNNSSFLGRYQISSAEFIDDLTIHADGTYERNAVDIADVQWVEAELSNKISIPETAEVGQVLRVSEVSEEGRVIAVEAVDSGLLPSPTADDNNKFLQVVDGAYTLVSILNASEVTY